MITTTRFHDFSAGHRVVGHEGKCVSLHGHNYRIHFEVALAAGLALDNVGRVIDFSCIKSICCDWLEDAWDHKLLLWQQDPWLEALQSAQWGAEKGIVIVEFNPTAENMAKFLLYHFDPILLPMNLVMRSVVVEETRKCRAEAWR